ncbi:Rieske (2Fe-2S) protein [Aquisalimonas sp.]|uniref:Rieske (2Fe-2S) protein n=1 Tax=Aquisalimonas sp. TaxID=1872621 RepID=UPI0025B8C559|nr:Rieske (2Fe-2S) protein [Aquisalimonas sp.]
MTEPVQPFVFAARLADLRRDGKVLVHGRGHPPVLVIHDHDHVYALDNRCPHMGFPLDRGSVEDGILTCHWHHARFDVASGCTFDLWADDVPRCPVEVRGDAVWVQPLVGYPDPLAHFRRRLDDGMSHNLALVIAKSVHGQLAAGAPPHAIVRQAALFGARNRDGWGVGLTILTALGNVLAGLPERDTCLALFHGVRRTADDCEGEPPRRERTPLDGAPSQETLQGWLRRWSAVRHREAAERTLLTAIRAGASPAALAAMLFAAETDRPYADSGHSLDFINKAFECLDQIGWEHASAVLPTVVRGMVDSRGAEESTAWRQPQDLISLLEGVYPELPSLFAAGCQHDTCWREHEALAEQLLGDDPHDVVESLKVAIGDGAASADLGKALACAAAVRLARFGTANEHGDWETAHHTFTYCNAVHQALRRIGADPRTGDACPAAVRGVFHGAMAVYLTRYLNVPPARLPGEQRDALDDFPAGGEDLRTALLDAFDRKGQVDAVGRLVARYLMLGHDPNTLLAMLAQALLREDAGFHSYQSLEAGIRQFREWEPDSRPARRILIGVARYLAAHSPTERAALQTADIAGRLMRGAAVHQGLEPRL